VDHAGASWFVLDYVPCLPAFQVHVVSTVGLTRFDITRAFLDGTYRVGLAAGKHVDLTLTTTATGPDATCPGLLSDNFFISGTAAFAIEATDDGDLGTSAVEVIAKLPPA
jgi:hypothetical protein